MPDLTTKDAWLERMVTATETIADNLPTGDEYLPLAGGTMTGTLTLDDGGTALSTAGGTMTGAITLSDGGTALSDATVGTVVDDSISSAVSVTANTGKELCSVSLTKGVWVLTGHAYFSGLTADKVYGIALTPTSGGYAYMNDSSVGLHTSTTGSFALQTVRIVTMLADGDYYLNAYCNVNATVSNAQLTAVRIV